MGLLTAEEADTAFAMADDRNLTVHTYNERLAEQICARLPEYAAVMDRWLSAMKGRIE